MPRPQPCQVDGVEYPSIRAAALALGESPKTRWGRLHPELNRARSALWHKRNPERSREKRRQYSGKPEPTRPCPATCELCDRPPGKRSLHLDHDHKTGAFRGWLCSFCNTGIGLLGDDPVRMRRAADYVER